LDAVEKAAPDLLKTPESAPVRRDSRNGVLSRIVEALKEKGPLNPNQIAEEVGASYRWVLLHLKQGPFRQEPRIGGKGGKTARRWVLDEEENGPNHAKGESES
jgi:predicted ArsR family transcriptional regulator